MKPMVDGQQQQQQPQGMHSNPFQGQGQFGASPYAASPVVSSPYAMPPPQQQAFYGGYPPQPLPGQQQQFYQQPQQAAIPQPMYYQQPYIPPVSVPLPPSAAVNDQDYYKGFYEGAIRSNGPNIGSAASWIAPLFVNIVFFVGPIWYIRRKYMQSMAGTAAAAAGTAGEL